MDHLRNALKGALGAAGKDLPEAAAPAEARAAAPAAPSLPDPFASEWVALLRRHEAVPANLTWGQLVQRSAARVRALKEAGRGRESAELKREQESFAREREKKAWAAVKDRFAELDLPEKAYRALKSEEADPVKVLAKLYAKRAEELRGAGAARVRDALVD